MGQTVLSVSGVKKHFGGHTVLDGVDIDIPTGGGIYQLIGPNGCGKTTLINVISGLLRPDGGRITFGDLDITHAGLYETYSAGLIRTWQIPRPFAWLTAEENIRVAGSPNAGESFVHAPARSGWMSDERRIAEQARAIIDMVGLAGKEGTAGGNLSGGQQKLLELGRALMSGATMILMDEPIAGVNPTLAGEIFERISDICRRQKITFLIVEHRLDIALQYVGHVFAMDGGRIIAQGGPDEIVKDPRVLSSYLGSGGAGSAGANKKNAAEGAAD